ncbi:MAG: hypothetical protein Q9168_003220 [Polycauliona sp. 1 TL-2023]
MHVSISALYILVLLGLDNGLINAAPANPQNIAPSGLTQTSRPSPFFPLPYGLTVPSLPELRISYNEFPDRPMQEVEMYCNSIFAMLALMHRGWNSEFIFQDFTMSAEDYRSELLVRQDPDALASHRLQNKHIIMAIYGLSVKFGPVNHFYYQVAAGYLQRGVRSFRVVIRPRRDVPQADGITEGTSNTTTTTTGAVLALKHNTSNPDSLALGDVPGQFIDPQDPGFIIRYTRSPAGTETIYIDNLFTTFTEALADLAPHDANELGAGVNTVGYERLTKLVILDAGRGGQKLLSYGRCIQALGQIWRGLVELLESLRTTRFDIEYRGVKLGSGFMKPVTPQVEAA